MSSPLGTPPSARHAAEPWGLQGLSSTYWAPSDAPSSLGSGQGRVCGPIFPKDVGQDLRTVHELLTEWKADPAQAHKCALLAELSPHLGRPGSHSAPSTKSTGTLMPPKVVRACPGHEVRHS